ncbi:hypothetical protein [Spirosoma fluviale]|uniref:Uncharacterized protein n=1 Tax=Spirosoma fluviale TaxID=1597977 RepID=A0A286F4F3_9BACT|nr:hypothetical protein [Spirosoma fluviale]SOD78101.1 hypothetical protein SAMN06269250_0292 [Spirosoma fluviale]
METPDKQEDIAKKVMDGFRLAHKRLVEKAKREDDTLVIERDGKILHVRARDL